MRFLQEPNLPKTKVKLIAMAAGNPEIKAAIETMGIEVLEVTPHESLAKPVASHPDMQIYDMGRGRVVAAKAADTLIERLSGLGFSVEEQELSEKYPGDTRLNCFLIGNNIYCNLKSISELLLNYYQSIGTGIVNIKQGYAKCSTCIVDENSIITADASIADAAGIHGVQVLKIESGGILLPGYNTGFIGGCCGLVAQDKLAFTGSLSGHPDGNKIKSFCDARGVKAIELTGSKLIDIGGILPLATY